MPAPLIKVDGHPDTLVAVVFDGLDGALTYGHALAEGFAHFGLGGARTLALGVFEHVVCDLTELIDAVRKLAA